MYEKYKESDLSGINEVPQHWQSIKLKFIGTLYSGLTGKSGDDFYDTENPLSRPYINFKNIAGNVKINPNQYDLVVITPEDQQNKVQKGDLFFLMSSENFGDIGKTALLDVELEDTYLNSFCRGFRLTDNNFDPCFLNYLLLCNLYRQHLSIEAKGFTRINIQVGKIQNFTIYAPQNRAEQTKIAQYLDHQTAIIDQLILQKEKLIELLKEKKQAVINEAVTKGLNPNAKTKDSGIEWLGEVPEHWDIAKMKYGCQFILDGTHGSYERVDEGYRLLSVRNIIDSKFTFRDDDSRVSERAYLEISSKFQIMENDIQLAIVGATLGKVAIVEKMDEPFVTQRSLATIRANTNKCIPKYLYYFLSSSSFQTYLWLSTSYSAQPGVYLGTIQKCPLPLPSLSEQDEIISHLVDRLSSYESLASVISQQIEKLKEYRQAIISEAVTGKIDVRDWQPNKQQRT